MCGYLHFPFWIPIIIIIIIIIINREGWKYQVEIWRGIASPNYGSNSIFTNMSSRNIRNSYRITRRAGQQGARPSASGQAEVEKLSTDLPSQPAVAANPTESLSQQGPSTPERAGTNTDRRNTRQKWTREDYIEVVFCYYKAKADPSEGVTKDTYRMWRERNPNKRPNLTDNALMNQRRFIEKQNKLTGIELDNIKQRVENELNVQNNQTDNVADDVSVEEANNLHEEPNEEEVEPSQTPSEIKDLVNEIKRARAEWENIRMAERPLLPKISMNRKTELLIKQANQAIQLVIAEEVPNLNNINLLQYVTAYVISEKLGKTPKIPKTKSNKRQQPKWKTRIENQIKSMRADLSILTDMAQKGETQKISKKNQRIKKKYKITTNVQELEAVRESLKMRIQAKAQRIRRYVKRSKQFSQNQMLQTIEKSSSETLVKNRYQLKNHLRKKQLKHFGVPSWRTIESTTTQQSG